MVIKKIDGFDYFVREDGEIFNAYGKKLKPYSNGKGYKKVSLFKDGKKVQFYVHRIVAECFIENPLGYEFVNHKDENPSNCNYTNLEWCSAKYNCNYGNRNKKISNSVSKRVYQISLNGRIIGSFLGVKRAAERTGISESNIRKALNGSRKTSHGFIWRYAP